jgi:hypothetical protein
MWNCEINFSPFSLNTFLLGVPERKHVTGDCTNPQSLWHAWDGRKVHKVLEGKSEGKRPLGIPRHRRETGIRMEIREIGWGCVN